MVSMKAIREANAAISTKSLTAVFVGATSGIGLSAIQALLKSTGSSKVFIVGRSQPRFSPVLDELQELDPSAKLIFIEAQVSLLKEVERVCTTVSSSQASLDLLWLSQGGLSLARHELTSEGLFTDYAVTYYSRMLFMQKLAALLHKSSDGRIISVLSPAMEGPLNTADPGLRDPNNYSFFKAQKQGVTMMSLAMHEQALSDPQISFLHTNPGMVSSAVHEKWAKTMTGALTPLRWLMEWALIPVMHFFAYTPDEAGQTGLFEATNEKFSRHSGKNFFRVWQDAEEIGSWGQAILKRYEDEGTRTKLWEHTLDVFEKVL